MTDPTPIAFHQEGEGWHLEPRRNRVLRFGVGALGVVGLGAGGSNLAAGEVGSGIGLLLFGAAMLTTAVMMSRRRTPLPPRHLGAAPGPGVLLPTRGGSLGAVVGFAALGLLFLVGGVGGGVRLLRDDDVVGVLWLLGGLGLGGLFLLGSWGTVKARRTTDRGILLTPEAVVLRTRQDPETLPWSALVRVRDHWGRGVRVGPTMPDDLIRNWLTFETREPDGDRLGLLSGSAHPSVPVEQLGTDPHLALTLCRYYLEQPAARAELADPGALSRWA